MSSGSTTDRVRANTSPEVNARIDREVVARVMSLATRDGETIARRIAELDREWDMERTLEANAATLAGVGVALGVVRGRRWLAIPGVVMAFLLQHALQGWCPPVPVFRRLGVRTRREIDREKYALKALRGDFAATADAGQAPSERARAALEAAGSGERRATPSEQ